MWWLDDGTLGGMQPEGDRSNHLEQELGAPLRATQLLAEIMGSESPARGTTAADAHDEPASPPLRPPASDEVTELSRQLDAATARLLAAETQLVETGLQHAAELAPLRLQIQTLEESVKKSQVARDELAATIDQRDAAHAEQLAELKQQRQESESQRATEAQSLRSELESLQGSLEKNEVVRSDLEARLEQRDLSHAAELAALTQQTESLQSKLEILQKSLAEAETERSDLQAASAQRDLSRDAELVALTQARREAEAALQESESQRAAEAQSLRSELESLQGSLEKNEVVRSDLEARLEQRDLSHAAELAALTQQTESLQSKLEILQKSLAEAETERSDLQAASAQRDLSRDAELVALTQARREAEAALQESESQRAAGAQSLQSELRVLEQTLAESETARDALQSAITGRDATHAAQLVESKQAREIAVACADELTAQLISLKKGAVTLQSRLDTEINNRAAADRALEQCRAVHAGKLVSLQAQIQPLQQAFDTHEASRRESEAAAEQREAECSLALVEAGQAREAAEQRANQLVDHLAAMDIERAALQVNLETEIQGHLIAVSGWRELERQHASQTESLQSKLLILAQLVHEHEAARHESNSELIRSNEEHAAELAKLDEAQQAAEQRNKELERQLQSLQHQLASLSTRADKESKSRVAAETELQRLTDEFRQLSDDAERTHGDYQNLQRHSAEQHKNLVTGIARLRQELDDRERQLRERDEQIARQATELEHRREWERRIRLEKEQLTAQHVEQIASLETQIAERRSQAEAERASGMHVEHELQQLAAELAQQLAEERELQLRSQSQLNNLQVDCARREDELDKLRDVSAAAMEAQRAAEKRIEEQIDRFQALQRQLDAARSSAAEVEARKSAELAEMRTALTTHASELAASRDHIKQVRQQVQEVILRNKDEQKSRHLAEALAEPLTQEVALQRKRVEAFRGLAQREAAARKKLEAAIKRSHDGADSAASMLAIRANIEVNQRIRRLTTELAATRNQELSVRQRAMQEIKRAQDEVQQLKDQLAHERRAA